MAASTDPNDPNFGLEMDNTSPNFGLAAEQPKEQGGLVQTLQTAQKALGFAQDAYIYGIGGALHNIAFPEEAKLLKTPLVSPEVVQPIRKALQYPIQTLNQIVTGQQFEEPLAGLGKFASEQIAGQTSPEALGLLAAGGIVGKMPKLREIAFGKPPEVPVETPVTDIATPVAPEAVPQTSETPITDSVQPIPPEEVIPNATQEGIVPESNIQEYPGNGEVRPPAEAGGGGGIEPSSEVPQEAVAPEEPAPVPEAATEVQPPVTETAVEPQPPAAAAPETYIDRLGEEKPMGQIVKDHNDVRRLMVPVGDTHFEVSLSKEGQIDFGNYKTDAEGRLQPQHISEQTGLGAFKTMAALKGPIRQLIAENEAENPGATYRIATENPTKRALFNRALEQEGIAPNERGEFKAPQGTAAPEAMQKVRDVFDKYDSGDEQISTPRDVAAELDGTEGLPPGIQKSIDDFHDAVRENREQYGERGGLEEDAGDKLISTIQDHVEASPETPLAKSPKAEVQPTPVPPETPPAIEGSVPTTPEVQKQTGISNQRLVEAYGDNAPVATTGKGPGAWKDEGLSRLDNFQKTGDVKDDPYRVLTNLREGKVPVADMASDVSLLRSEHQRLLEDARNSEGTPDYEAKSQAALDMATAIKGVAHGPASDVFRALQEYDVPRYDNVTDFDQALRERLGRESTSQERASFKQMADDVTSTRNGAEEAINGAQKQLGKYPRMNFDDAAKNLHDQIAELTKNCVI